MHACECMRAGSAPEGCCAMARMAARVQSRQPSRLVCTTCATRSGGASTKDCSAAHDTAGSLTRQITCLAYCKASQRDASHQHARAARMHSWRATRAAIHTTLM